MIYRDIDLRKQHGYEPVQSPYMYQRPEIAFRHPEVVAGNAVVFQIGVDIWGVYYRSRTSIALWSKRHSGARGWYWKRERNCAPTTATEWLALYQADEPNVEFVLSVSTPRI